jgi:hypothetical protein
LNFSPESYFGWGFGYHNKWEHRPSK